MPYVPVNCTSCGGEVQLDDTKEYGYCLHCGTKVYFQDAIQKVELTNLPKIENLLKIANSEFEGGHFIEATQYYNRALELDSDNWQAILFKAISQFIQSPNPEGISSASNKALALAKKENLSKVDIEKFINTLSTMLTAMVAGKDLSKFERFGSLDLYSTFLHNYLGSVEGYEFCVPLLEGIPDNKSKLINIYGKILSLLSESSKYKHLLNGKKVGANRIYRPNIIQKFDKYRRQLLALDPYASLPELVRGEVERQACYIATAIYGSYDASQVLILRGYRDNTLLKTTFGRIFVKSYYWFSPSIANKLHGKTMINSLVKRTLDRSVENIRH